MTVSLPLRARLTLKLASRGMSSYDILLAAKLSLVTADGLGEGLRRAAIPWMVPNDDEAVIRGRSPVYSTDPNAHQGGSPCLSCSLRKLVLIVHTIHKGFPPHPLPQDGGFALSRPL